MKLKVAKPPTEIQRVALEARLELLGIELGEDRTIRPECLERLPGGQEALGALADEDGVLSLKALEGLRPAIDLLRPARFGAWVRLRGISLAVDGLRRVINKQLEGSAEGFDPSAVPDITRRASQVLAQISLLDRREGDLKHGPAGTIDALAHKVGELSKDASRFLRLLSKSRLEIARQLRSAPAPDATKIREAKLALETLEAGSVLAEALLRTADAVSIRRIGSTVLHCLGAQLEGSSSSDPGELAFATSLAIRRTERIFGLELGKQEARARIEEAVEQLGAERASGILALLDSGDGWLKAPVPEAAELERRAREEPLGPGLDTLREGIERVDVEALLRALEEIPALKALLSEWSGVSEGYSLRTHVQRVLSAFQDQAQTWDLAEMARATGLELGKLLLATLAFHDIGKPAAVEAGDKEAQHAFTLPLLTRLLEALGFSPRDVELARTLVDNDLLGQLVKAENFGKRDSIDLEKAFEEICAMAERNGLSRATYLRLQALYYTLDASSYPWLRKRVFTEVDGLVRPKSDTLKILEARAAELPSSASES